MNAKPKAIPKNPILPHPEALGVFVLSAAILALLAGYLRNELLLTLLGAIFFAVPAWYFAALLITAFLQRKKNLSVDVEILAMQIKTGEPGELRLRKTEKFFALPGIFVRYNMKLSTLDGRCLECMFDPRKIGNGVAGFPASERGAYFGPFDELLFLDGPGFFRLAFPVPRGKDARLFVVPEAAPDKLPVFIHSGGREKRSDLHYRKTDTLAENRPYVPGDDPRRINWKLYGHGPESELYVREGENSPPPHSRLLLLIDTQADPLLYSLEESRNEVDMLCENARRTIFELGQRGIEVSVGSTGEIIRPADAEALARPAARPLLSSNMPGNDILPFSQKQTVALSIAAGQNKTSALPDETGILVLALPRGSTGQTALDRFLAARPPRQSVDLFFLYTSGKGREEAARTCTAFYRRKNNIYVGFHNSDILEPLVNNEMKEHQNAGTRKKGPKGPALS